jgi:hypothetical protein
VELVGETQRRRVVSVEAELIVGYPRRFVEIRLGIADEPAAREPPVRHVGAHEFRQLREQPLTRHLVVVEIQDPAAAAL